MVRKRFSDLLDFCKEKKVCTRHHFLSAFFISTHSHLLFCIFEIIYWINIKNNVPLYCLNVIVYLLSCGVLCLHCCSQNVYLFTFCSVINSQHKTGRDYSYLGCEQMIFSKKVLYFVTVAPFQKTLIKDRQQLKKI